MILSTFLSEVGLSSKLLTQYMHRMVDLCLKVVKLLWTIQWLMWKSLFSCDCCWFKIGRKTVSVYRLLPCCMSQLIFRDGSLHMMLNSFAPHHVYKYRTHATCSGFVAIFLSRMVAPKTTPRKCSEVVLMIFCLVKSGKAPREHSWHHSHLT